MRPLHVIAATLASVTIATATARADVQVGIHIDLPAPPVFTFEAPPRLIVVPGVPHVHYAPDISVNFFSYGGRYYTYDGGHWFVASTGYGPWGYVEHHHVPGVLLRIPRRYYHVPPRLVGGGHWYGKHSYHHDGGKKWKQGKHHGGGKHKRGGKHGHRH